MKKIITTIIIFFIIFCPMFAYGAEPAAYKLPNGRISVDEDVFNQLVTNEKKMEVYKEEVEYLKKSIEELKTLYKTSDSIQEQRVTVLKDTIELKDQIIVYKDDNIKNWEKIYNVEHSKVNKLKTMSLIEKILITGLTAYAISNIDDSSAQAAVGAIGASIIFLDW